MSMRPYTSDAVTGEPVGAPPPDWTAEQVHTHLMDTLMITRRIAWIEAVDKLKCSQLITLHERLLAERAQRALINPTKGLNLIQWRIDHLEARLNTQAFELLSRSLVLGDRNHWITLAKWLNREQLQTLLDDFTTRLTRARLKSNEPELSGVDHLRFRSNWIRKRLEAL